jgi:hypothetical protein
VLLFSVAAFGAVFKYRPRLKLRNVRVMVVRDASSETAAWSSRFKTHER